MNVVIRGRTTVVGGVRERDCGMGMEPRHKWNSDVPLVPVRGTTSTVEPPAPAKKSRWSKLLLTAFALALTLVWAAFLCNQLARLIGSLL